LAKRDDAPHPRYIHQGTADLAPPVRQCRPWGWRAAPEGGPTPGPLVSPLGEAQSA